MLQPQNYPKLLGQAMVLEPDPFVEMVDDDNPWIEGLFLCTCIGVLIAIAQIVGGLLLTAVLPPSEAVLGAILQSLRQGAGGGERLLSVENTLRSVLPLVSWTNGYDSGWLRLIALATTPFSLILQWLLFGISGHLIARMVGGQGSLSQTLGALALSTGPRLLLLLTAVPFVSIGGALIHVWGLLIAYRGLEVAHELSPGRAALAAIGPWLVLVVLSAVFGSVAAALIGLAGGGP